MASSARVASSSAGAGSAALTSGSSVGGLDGGSVADASCAPHVGEAETGVPCGGDAAVCGAARTCCGAYGGARCETTCNTITQAPILCDGPEDCPTAGDVCCGNLTSGMACVPQAQCASGGAGLHDDYRLCNVATDCPAPSVCRVSTALRPFAGTAVGGCLAACP